MKTPYAVAVLLYCAGIFALSSQPRIDTPSMLDIPGLDKFMHALEFGGLAALVSVGLRRSHPLMSPDRLFWIPWLFASLYGLSDEVHQLFVPMRTFDWVDWLADCGGAGLASGFLHRYGEVFSARKPA